MSSVPVTLGGSHSASGALPELLKMQMPGLNRRRFQLESAEAGPGHDPVLEVLRVLQMYSQCWKSGREHNTSVVWCFYTSSFLFSRNCVAVSRNSTHPNHPNRDPFLREDYCLYLY